MSSKIHTGSGADPDPDPDPGPTLGAEGDPGGGGIGAGLGTGLIASAAMIAAITTVSRIAGFGRWVVFSGNVSAGCVGDAYATANVLPNVLFEVVAGGALAGAVVPLLAGPISRAVAGRAEVDRIASALLTWALLVLVPASIVLGALSGPLSRLLIDDKCDGQQALTARLLLVFAPQIALYGVGVVLSGVLTAHRRFFWPAFAPLLSSVVVIVAYLEFGRTAHHDLDAPAALPRLAEAWLAWGTTAGVAVMTLPLLVPIWRAGIRLRPTLSFPAGVGRRGIALAGAGIGALLAQQASVLVTVALAGHRGGAGALPVFQYAQAVYLLPYAVLAVPLATSTFPRLAERAAAGDRDGYAVTAAASTRAVVAAGLLGTALLTGVAPPIARFFADLDKGNVDALRGALTVMAPGLVGFGLIAHVARALYALERGRVAAVATIAGWLAVIVGSLVAVTLGSVVQGLAWGNTIGMSVAGLLLLAGLRREAGPAAVAGLPRMFAVGAVAAVAGAFAGRETGLATLSALPGGTVGSVVAGIPAALAALAAFAAVLALLDRRDLKALIGRLR
jgi:putative peptidoglycan lipid II flippase